MDPVSLLLGALVLTGMGWVGVAATSDAYATVKAAQASAWDVIDRQRDRRASFWQRLGQAWVNRRRARHEAAGGDGEFRPGARAYLADVYHGFWEDRIERRAAKRAARGPYVFDPDRLSWADRFDAAVMRKVDDLRERWGQRTPERVADTPLDELLEPQAVESTPEPVVHEPGTWTVGDQGQRVDLAPAGDNEPVVADSAERLGAVDATHGTNDQQHVESPTRGGTTMTAPTTTAATVDEVQDNEAARRNFKTQQEAAGEGLEALAMYEAAIARLAGAANASADGMAATRFDSGATGAQANIADLIPATSIAAAAGALEEMKVHAEAGLRSLDKYRDAEDLVASEGVDAKTLEPTSV